MVSTFIKSTTTTDNLFYDQNGNQLSKLTNTTKPSDGASSSTVIGGEYEYYSYDGFDRMTHSVVDYVSTAYTYRPDGLRHTKTTNGQTTTHIWDGSNISLDILGVGITKYTRGINLVASENTGTKQYFLFNAHGDVTRITNTAGATTKRYDYDAFGVERNPVEGDINPWRYCGEYWDKETGTVHLTLTRICCFRHGTQIRTYLHLDLGDTNPRYFPAPPAQPSKNRI